MAPPPLRLLQVVLVETEEGLAGSQKEDRKLFPLKLAARWDLSIPCKSCGRRGNRDRFQLGYPAGKAETTCAPCVQMLSIAVGPGKIIRAVP
jgi:hypothetical protein